MRIASLLVFVLVLVAVPLAASNLTDDFMKGSPDIKSIGSLAFGPEGILFAGDSKGGAIFAINTGDKTPSPNTDALEVEDIDEKIASMLGTTVKDIAINDLAVNPISQNAYLSVSRGSGNDGVDLLLRVTPAGKIEEVPLQDVHYSKKSVSKIVAEETTDGRGRSLRNQAITDLVYHDGQLFIAGLSNEEFSSTLRVTPFPFADKEQSASLEIYHAAHKQYETNAPIRTFLAYDLKDVSHVLAAYTCTPLVTFPMSNVQDGGHVKGKTVAELGSGNRPLDMLVYEQDNQEFILVANSNRTLMKIDPQDIAIQEEIIEPVTERFGTAGVGFVAVNQVGVQEMDNLNADNVLVIQRMGNGSLNLHSLPKRRL
jgi:hypothetical protein